MIIEVDGIWYISVKGTAKAYNISIKTIHYHMDQNQNIFNNHFINLKENTFPKKLEAYFTSKQLKAHDKWLDKFTFLEIGTLLNDSPKMIPIKVIYFLNKE